MFRFSAASVAMASMLVAALPGCKDREIASYRVRKEATGTPVAPAPSGPIGGTAPSADTASSMASTPVPTAEGLGLEWSAPAQWTAKPASAMRRATYMISGRGSAIGELAVTAFPGNVGGNLANVNRWRGQIQLEPVTEADLGRILEHHDAGDLHIDVVDIKADTGSDPQRIIGAIVPLADSTWFFKFSGPDSLLTAEKPVIIEFLKTIRAKKS